MKAFTVSLFASFLLLMMMTSTTFAQSTEIKVSEKDPYGKYLTDGSGMSLYLFKGDKSGQSNCNKACAEAWPPLTTKNKEIEAGSDVNKGMLGIIMRSDGSMQVTYNDHPLYYFKGDKEEGDVNGQDKKGFGAEWYLLTPDGKEMGDVEEEEK